MSGPSTSEDIKRCIDGVFEIQAALVLMSKRLNAVGDLGGPDENEIMSLSRVADLCVRSLDNVAELLELAEQQGKKVA